jgi:hypothetical protein
MNRTTRTTLAFATLLTGALALSGCSLLGLDGPPRGDDGQVTETTVIQSTQLLEGDCFTFVDGSNNNKAEVTPCTEEHKYIVIGQGSLSQSEVDKAGGLQNAVSAACKSSFEEFKAAAAEGVRPEQEFIVSQVTEDDVVTSNYSCVATDGSGAS